jgi:hypothetical protein
VPARQEDRQRPWRILQIANDRLGLGDEHEHSHEGHQDEQHRERANVAQFDGKAAQPLQGSNEDAHELGVLGRGSSR